MSYRRTRTRSTALLALAVLGVASSCSAPTRGAQLEGVSSVDLVAGSERLGPDHRKDALISLRLPPGGTVTTLTVHNVDGQPARWDTVPGNSFWALGVATEAKPSELLNAADGSVTIDSKEASALLLYLTDNGAVQDGKTRFSVTVGYSDGRQDEIPVE